MRVTLALFSAGLATFALLYCVQPILPVLSQEFGLTPANSSISLSRLHGDVGYWFAVYWPLSDAIGRKPVVTALLLASICTLLSTMMTNWRHFDYARLDWAFVKWRGSCWHDLS